jgi:uncharacterized membrane-anchored protein YhcB (DUF1043 family)
LYTDGLRTEYELKISELTEKFQDESSKAQSAQTCVTELRIQLDEARQEVVKRTSDFATILTIVSETISSLNQHEFKVLLNF